MMRSQNASCTSIASVGAGSGWSHARAYWRPGPLTVALGAITQYGSQRTLSAESQDGFAMGSLQSFNIAQDGTIAGVFSNGLTRAVGRIALASFTNPGGLEKAGGSNYRTTVNSGLANVGDAGLASVDPPVASIKFTNSNGNLDLLFSDGTVDSQGYITVFASSSSTTMNEEEILNEPFAAAKTVYVIVRGTGLMSAAGDAEHLVAGDLALIPPATEHSIANDGEDQLALVSVQSPAVSIEELYERQLAGNASGYADLGDEYE